MSYFLLLICLGAILLLLASIAVVSLMTAEAYQQGHAAGYMLGRGDGWRQRDRALHSAHYTPFDALRTADEWRNVDLSGRDSPEL